MILTLTFKVNTKQNKASLPLTLMFPSKLKGDQRYISIIKMVETLPLPLDFAPPLNRFQNVYVGFHLFPLNFSSPHYILIVFSVPSSFMSRPQPFPKIYCIKSSDFACASCPAMNSQTVAQSDFFLLAFMTPPSCLKSCL